mmetsp:Transcript_35433/g.58256  ORF Transcript_35433/g.58256 Transcript_35433/m.58256 type:complete len:108 (-) Transcript_35433:921-1244(-)
MSLSTRVRRQRSSGVGGIRSNRNAKQRLPKALAAPKKLSCSAVVNVLRHNRRAFSGQKETTELSSSKGPIGKTFLFMTSKATCREKAGRLVKLMPWMLIHHIQGRQY